MTDSEKAKPLPKKKSWATRFGSEDEKTRGKIVMGIDPGLTGAIAAIDADAGEAEVWPMPTLTKQVGKSRRKVLNMPRLTAIIANVDPYLVLIEEVHSMPKQGVASTFSFGRAFGLVEGVCAGMQLSYMMVKPQDWKRFHGLKAKGKDEAVEFAGRMFPEVDFGNKGQMSGTADALLIALCGAVRVSGGESGVRSE